MIILDAGTDVAMLGLWDANAPRDDIGKSNPGKFQELLDEDAHKGKLIYINTSSDGSFSIGICLCSNDLPEDLEKWYTQVDRRLFLNVESGQVIAGGLEDYRSSNPQITGDADLVTVRNGVYQISAYQAIYDDERKIEEIRDIVGEDEYAYYSSRSTGCLAFFVLFIAGLACSIFWSWWVIIPAILTGIVNAIYRSKVNSKDERYMKVQMQIDKWDSNHPVVVFLLKAVVSMGESDGYFDLDYETAEQDA